jgi:antitoxin (DNA-binding transcriptional repressor) of toxin-antitoxin stability system
VSGYLQERGSPYPPADGNRRPLGQCGDRRSRSFYLTTLFYALILCVMKTVTIMQAQHNLSKVLRALKPGEKMGITRHKKIVAEVTMPSMDKVVSFPDFLERSRNTWGDVWQGLPSDELLDESRGER